MSNTEIVVVGAGVAGLSAALAVAGTGHDVTLVTKAELVESNTYHAQGGIAAAIFSDDDPKLHAADTMAAGHGLCDPKAVDILTREGAERVREFAAAGVHFDRDAHGHMLRGLEAAHSRARVVHAGGDATGKVFELDVSAMVRKNPRIHIIENAFLKDLIVRGGHIAGVHLLIDGQDKDLAADRDLGRRWSRPYVPVHHQSAGRHRGRPRRRMACRCPGRRSGVLPVPSHRHGRGRALPRFRSRARRRCGAAG